MSETKPMPGKSPWKLDVGCGILCVGLLFLPLSLPADSVPLHDPVRVAAVRPVPIRSPEKKTLTVNLRADWLTTMIREDGTAKPYVKLKNGKVMSLLDF